MNNFKKRVIEFWFALFMWAMVCVAMGLFSNLCSVKLHGRLPLGHRVQLFFLYDENAQFNEINSKSKELKGNTKEFVLPNGAVSEKMRIDFGDSPNVFFLLDTFIVRKGNRYISIDKDSFEKLKQKGVVECNDIKVNSEKQGLLLETLSNDAYIIFDGRESNLWKNDFKREIFISVTSLFLTLLLVRYIKKNHIFVEVRGFVSDIVRNKKILFGMAKTDFISHYAGSYLGIVWAVVQPIFTILIYCLVFQVGLKSGSSGDVPFALWLTVGLVPWFFFSDAWNSSTNVFLEYSYLVKKVVFSLNILPLVKIISALFTHIAFLMIAVGAGIGFGVYPTANSLMIIYYLFALICMTMGLSLLTAPIVVFFRDLTHVLAIVLQFGIWLTPIMWNINIFPDEWKAWFKLNPMFYVVQGYRNALSAENVGIFDDIQWTMYFWVVVIVVLVVGFSTFSKLKEHMADVL